MEKVSVFIDGGYLDHIIQDIGKKVDYSKLARKLCGSDNFMRAYYYHCLPYQSDPPTEEEKTRFSKASAFFDRLKRLDRFQIRLGKLAKRGNYSDGNPILIQKRVDVYLATDLVKFSARKGMDQAVLLTSDSDYVPAIAASKEFGVIVKLAYYDNLSINQELLDACDERFSFSASFFDDILR
uniref:NYN domain-containing protein n=1 Tax=Candidatus Desulfatibia profunda TaxID=2841695 RepID=A0A8J6TN36_9BACT|nr:NYN domain-containing protein [Candidatus Desulfatibia profunda]